MLWQVGCPNNPGSTDGEIFGQLSQKLGVEDRYERIRDDILFQRRAKAHLSK